MAYAPVYYGDGILPDADDVREGVDRGDGTSGTLDVPATTDVKLDVGYGSNSTELTGTLVPGGTVLPPGDVRWLR